MADDKKPLSNFDKELIARTKEARERGGFTQEEISAILGIAQDRYKQYETRTKLPLEFVERFCLACKVSIDWLVTGKMKARPKVLALTE